MDLAAVSQILSDAQIKAVFQASLLTANLGGWTVRELANQLGVSKSSIHRYLVKVRDKREKARRLHQKVDLIYPPDAYPKCEHAPLIPDGRKRVCLRCVFSNFEGAPELRRNENFDPVPEDQPKPAPKFKPRQRKRAKS